MAEDAVCSNFPRLIAHQKEMIQGTSQILDDPIQQLLLRGLRARPWEDFLTFWRDNDSTSRSASNPDRIREVCSNGQTSKRDRIQFCRDCDDAAVRFASRDRNRQRMFPTVRVVRFFDARFNILVRHSHRTSPH
jgi:hypothetical protein